MSLFARIWKRNGLSWLWIGRESRALGFVRSGEITVIPQGENSNMVRHPPNVEQDTGWIALGS